MKSLKEQVQELEISQPQGMPLVRSQSPSIHLLQDIDPEDDPFAKRDNASDSDEAPSEAGITDREHYEKVSKSKLRKPEQPLLGEQYTGTAVSRKTLFDEEGNVQEAEDKADSADDEDDEPGRAEALSSVSSVKSGDVPASSSEIEDEADRTDMRMEDSANADGDDPDIDSDEAFASGEEEVLKSKGFTFRGSKQDPVAEDVDAAEEGDSDEDGALMWDTEDEEEVESGQDVEMEDEATESDEESQDASGSDSGSGSESNTSSEPSKNSRTPITARDKLKDLLTNDAATVASTLSASANADGQKGRAVKQQHQTFDRLLDARIKLQKGLTAANNISIIANPDPEVSLAAKAAETAALKLFSTIESIRHSISEAASTSASKKRKRHSPPTSSTPTSALWARLSILEDQSLPHRQSILNKWSSKTRSAVNISAPRSQLDRPTTHDTTTMTSMLDASLASSTPQQGTYDDTPFYQSLLRDLIASRASLSQSQPPEIPLPPAPPKQHRKGVDTKASKGRKVTYTVHEKLQNFAAEEERGTWTENARREFFASLFGGTGMLEEGRDVDEDGDADGDEGVGEEGALRLFRS